jgi:hypothetical protein
MMRVTGRITSCATLALLLVAKDALKKSGMAGGIATEA